MHNEGVVVAVRAVLLGERLDTRNLELQRLTPTGPATLRIADGYAIVFRYGAVVMFDVPADQETSLLNSLRPLTTEPYDVPDRDATRLAIRPDLDERINSAGIIYIRDAAIERIQAIAHILAQSLVLAHYEAGIAAVFDRIEPLAAALETQGRVGVRGKELISQIGTVLRVQHRMVGRVETGEKPDMLWDHPELERLYARLADEYELKERNQGLDRKLELISRTVVTLQGLLQNRSSTRLEWYIVLLIVAEIALSIFALFAK